MSVEVIDERLNVSVKVEQALELAIDALEFVMAEFPVSERTVEERQAIKVLTYLKNMGGPVLPKSITDDL